MDDQKLETVPCLYCRGVILVGAKRCKYCHADLSGLWPKEAMGKRTATNPPLAAFLSLLVPGLGHYYCGRTNKAIIFLFVFVMTVGLFYWLIFPWVLVALCASADAFREARKTP